MKARDVKGSKSDRIIQQHGRVLPKKLYVRYEWKNDDPYLEVAEDVEELAEKGEVSYVGEYRLVTVRKVSLDLRLEVPRP